MSDDPVIEARGLRREFTVSRRIGRFRRERVRVEAVAGVDLSIAAGETVGYLGPNGAGKSTTLKMLTGVLAPSGGTARVCGLDPLRRRTRLARRVGVVFGQRSALWWDLPLVESFTLLRYVYRVPPADHARRLAECVQLLDLGPFLATPVRQLSLGQRIRGEVTAALLHGPEVLFLDEPTIGLDVVSRVAVRDFLARLGPEHGTTIVLTTHDLADVERLCPRLVVVDHGRVVHDGTLGELHSRFGSRRQLVLDLAEPAGPVRVPGAEWVRAEAEGRRQWLALDGSAPVAAVIASVAGAVPVLDLAVREPDIEDVVRRLYAAGPPSDRTAL